MSTMSHTTLETVNENKQAVNRRAKAADAMFRDLRTPESAELAARVNTPVRMEMVNAIKQQITEGKYEDSEKIERALDLLLADLTD